MNLDVKGWAAVVTALGTIAGAGIYVDSRYAHAADVRQAQSSIEKSVAQSVLENKKWQIEDRLMSLEMKQPQNRSDFENAQVQRYKRELDEVNRDIRNLKKP